MKKIWCAPELKTLDVRLTESGTKLWPVEGAVIFDPNKGGDVHAGPVLS